MIFTPTVPTACPLCGAEIIEVTATTGDSMVCCDNEHCPWTFNEDDA